MSGEPQKELIIEIGIKVIEYEEKEARLVTFRNVNYVIEQQRLMTQAFYDRKLTDTLSHELLTPLNCIINLSEQFKNKLMEYLLGP